MRKTYRNILKHRFHASLIQARTSKGFTQSEMAERLFMDDRSYIDLEHGKTCCSAVTLILFLLYLCDDVDQFLQELCHAFEVGIDWAA